MSAIVEDSKNRAMKEDSWYAGGITVSEVGAIAAALGVTLAEFILRSS